MKRVISKEETSIVKLESRWNIIKLLFAFVIFVSLLFSVSVFQTTARQDGLINRPGDTALTEIKKVDLVRSDGARERVNLPKQKPPSDSYYFDFEIPKKTGEDRQFLHFNLSYATYALSYEGKLIDSNRNKENLIPLSGGKSFNLIEIPEEYLGKVLRISFESTLKKKRPLLIPKLRIGEKASILKQDLTNGLLEILSSMILLVTGVFLFLIAIYFYTMNHTARSIFIVSLFSINLGLYILTRSWILYYYLNNSPLIYFVEYMSMMAIPLPVLLLFINSFLENGSKNWRVPCFKALAVIIMGNIFLQFLLTILGISEFILLQKLSMLILLSSTFFIFLSIATVSGEDLGEKYYLLLSVAPMGGLLVLILLTYFSTYKVSYIPYIILVALFFLFVHFVVAIRKYVHVFSLSIEKTFYEELAYLDLLTGIKNRHSFDRSLAELRGEHQKFKILHLLMIDLNNLKSINDTCGHNTGDEYIRRTGQILKELEKRFSDIEVYRYAGDEFVMLCFDKTEETVSEIIQAIKDKASAYRNRNSELPLSIAIGYESLKFSLSGLEEIDLINALDKADEKMYLDKAKYKESVVHGQ